VNSEQWVKQALAAFLQPDSSIRFTDADNNAQDVPQADFLVIFGAAIDAALAAGTSVYDALTSGTFTLDGASYTAADLGFQPYFDQWHSGGVF
jgi:hypothetical protein